MNERVFIRKFEYALTARPAWEARAAASANNNNVFDFALIACNHG
jgi:hypothetical protein